MTKRLQVLFDDEYVDLQRVAREDRMTVAEWVRQALRPARLGFPLDGLRRAGTMYAGAGSGESTTLS